MQLVIHSPFGSRLNRAWGLALRKRFCRTFNFELQAAATEDAILLSLSTSHSFPLDDVVRYLHSATALDVLVQALLDAPLFGVRWRWNATTALALPRFTGGRKVAPQLQRMKSEDLLAAVFPDQVACAENLAGAREIPEHPLVEQTLQDCLFEAMDAKGWLALLRRIESGAVEVVARDLGTPSPFAAEAINARPYAYLDDAPIEERRTQAVQGRRYADPQGADDMGRLDPEAIESVRQEAWPRARNADEMHEALSGLGVVTDREAAAQDGWAGWLAELGATGRATRLSMASDEGRVDGGLWVAAERLAQVRVMYPGAALDPVIDAPSAVVAVVKVDAGDALRDLLRSRLGGLGPASASALAASLTLPRDRVDAALAALQREGSVLQGRFTHQALQGGEVEWCERHLLARIHRYTLKRLRREIEPVEPRDFVRFLFEWQHLADASRLSGPEALAGVLSQLEGFEAPAAMWEAELLPARVRDYATSWLDDLCTAGRTLWTRLRPVAVDARSGGGGGAASLRSTPIVLLPRRAASFWARLVPAPTDEAELGARARRVTAVLAARGASFFDEIADAARLLPAELEDALAEAVVRGRVHCDSYAGLRALLVPAAKRASAASSRRRRGVALSGIADAGRWSLIRPSVADDTETRDHVEAASPAAPIDAHALDPIEQLVRVLLRRYGVVSWRILEREAAWLPPWRDLVRVCRRLEARGEIRGGRFLAGLSGEQYALPEAIGLLREVRRRPADGSLICLAATDPANLLGTVVPGPRVPRIGGSRVLYRDGVPIATSVGGQVELLVSLEAAELPRVTRALALDPALRELDRSAEQRRLSAAAR
ncbi:MAG: ATP-dependent DNA helicase, partial [Caldimonas sp.]